MLGTKSNNLIGLVFINLGITAIIRQFQWITNAKPETRKEHVVPHRFSRSDSFEDRSEFVLMVSHHECVYYHL